jgi:hypothetical protein
MIARRTTFCTIGDGDLRPEVFTDALSVIHLRGLRALLRFIPSDRRRDRHFAVIVERMEQRSIASSPAERMQRSSHSKASI